jgi:hypothetical protein
LHPSDLTPPTIHFSAVAALVAERSKLMLSER